MTPLWIGLAIFGVFAVIFLWVTLRTRSDRRSGLFPPAGKATMADVERLVRGGQHIHAIRCYREIHHCGLLEAKKAIEELDRTG